MIICVLICPIKIIIIKNMEWLCLFKENSTWFKFFHLNICKLLVLGTKFKNSYGRWWEITGLPEFIPTVVRNNSAVEIHNNQNHQNDALAMLAELSIRNLEYMIRCWIHKEYVLKWRFSDWGENSIWVRS